VKILMVDDSAADRRYYRLLLGESNGATHQIYEAGTAAEGLARCRELQPDCILLDYRLPDMDGLEFLARIHPDGPDTDPAFAVVMLTGVAGDEMAVKALRAGAHDYLIKDAITAEGLRLAVEKATQKVGLIRALREERDRLARSLAEKEVLIKEVHHRVKNNLQVVASLLRLQCGATGDPAAAAALAESQRRVEAMAMVHEQLYESENLREIDLARHAHLLLSNVLTSFGADAGRIVPVVDVQGPSGAPIHLGVDQAIPVGLVLNELASNALKHAFPEGRPGSLAIRARAEGGMIRISVVDDGVGLPEGADFRSSKSLGLKIVEILARQLKGSFAAADIPRGTCLTLTFPEK
jgi:two-component sensor histidine kinase